MTYFDIKDMRDGVAAYKTGLGQKYGSASTTRRVYYAAKKRYHNKRGKFLCDLYSGYNLIDTFILTKRSVEEWTQEKLKSTAFYRQKSRDDFRKTYAEYKNKQKPYLARGKE